MKLLRERLASELSPSAALLAARDDSRPLALVGAWAGGGAIIASDPVTSLRPSDDPLAALDRMPTVEGDGEHIGGGWFGFLGYGLGAAVEQLPPAPPDDVPLPSFSFAFYDHVLRRDARGQWWFEALWSETSAARLDRRLAQLRLRMAAPARQPAPRRIGSFTMRPSAAGHRAAVQRCLEHIAAGDLYQANLTMRLDAHFDGDAIDLFAACHDQLRPAYAAYIGDPCHQVVSMSPELFLERRGQIVRTAPIKGTIPRTGDEAHDQKRLSQLTASEKDRAENVMIVDLMRNDLGRVCAYGTVSVAAFGRPEPHPGVWHLVSDVCGTLRPGISNRDLLRATFPPGSVTGAPKIKAMEVISELESTARQAYTGAVGFASPSCGLHLNVAIRTFEVANSRIWLSVGSGIVADSTPSVEYEECLVKARPLLNAARASLAPNQTPLPSRRVPRPTRHPRPDPSHGIFETLLGIDGHAHNSREHCARLAFSAAALYDRDINIDRLVDDLQRVSATHPSPQRLHVTMLPGGNPNITNSPLPHGAILPRRSSTLEPLALPGGLGSHKWRDRRLLDTSITREPLLVELDGEVLETARGNIFAVLDGVLVTPRCDGRLLRGVTRSEVLDIARTANLPVREQRLDLDSLRTAREVFVTSSIRLLQPASLGEEAPRGPVTAQLTMLIEAKLRGDPPPPRDAGNP